MLSNILKGGSLSLIRQVLSLIISLYTFSIITNAVPPKEFGSAMVSILTVTILGLVLTWSYNGVLIKNIAENISNNNKISALYNYNYALSLIFLFVVFLFLLYSFIFEFYWAIFLLSTLLFVNILDSLFGAILSGYQLYIKCDWSNICQPVVFFSLFYFFNNEVTSSDYILYYLISVSATLFLKLILINVYIDENVFLFEKCSIFDLYKESTSVFFANLVGAFVYRFHYFIISVFLGAEYLGVFAFSQQIVEKIWLLSGAYASVIYPILSSGDFFKNKHVIKKVLNLTFVIVLVMSTSTIAFGLIPDYYFTLIFNESYLPSKEIVMQMSIGIGAWGGVKIIAAIFSSLRLFKYNLITSLISLFVSSLLVLFLSWFNPSYIGFGIGLGYLAGFIFSLVKVNGLFKGNVANE